MRYAAIDDLIERVSINDLAERASPENSAVTGVLLRKKLDGQALSGESQAVRDALTLAVNRLNQALDDASAEIDGFIGRLLPLPNPPPPVIKLRCIDIALYRLFGGGDAGDLERIYREAIAWLRDVADGKIAFTDDDGADQDGNDVIVDAPERVFGQKKLKEFLA